MSDLQQRRDLKKSDWYKRWRTGRYRQELTYLKTNHSPSKTHPKIDGLYDFRAANLRMAKLAGAKLSNCNFDEAQLYEAILQGAALSKSSLSEADLCESNLSNTKIENSRLVNARMRSANLSNSSLAMSNLTGADLTFANLLEVDISGTNLSLTNLTLVNNLGTTIGTPSSADGAKIDFKSWKSIRDMPLGILIKKSGEIMPPIYDYDIAISFAGEDRRIAEEIADKLTAMGIRVFYDKYETADLWGKDLYTHLIEVYRERAKYCLMLISKNYAEKLWTNHERKAAQARAFEEHQEYILPLYIDNTKINGILPTIAYTSLKDHSIVEIADLIKQKLLNSK